MDNNMPFNVSPWAGINPVPASFVQPITQSPTNTGSIPPKPVEKTKIIHTRPKIIEKIVEKIIPIENPQEIQKLQKEVRHLAKTVKETSEKANILEVENKELISNKENVQEKLPEPALQTIQPKEEIKEEKNLIPTERYYASPIFYEIANYFDVQPNEYDKVKNQLSVIVDWAVTQSKTNDPFLLRSTISQLENKIMKPAWSETRCENVYRYLRLEQETQKKRTPLWA